MKNMIQLYIFGMGKPSTSYSEHLLNNILKKLKILTFLLNGKEIFTKKHMRKS